MHTVTVADRLRYAFDNYMARGTTALILGLALISGLIIMLAGLLLTAAQIRQPGEDPYSLGEAMWLSLMRTLDAGTMGGDAGGAFRFAMLGVTLGGIFIVSALIGVLNNGLEDKLGELRKGRSRVVEAGHTVILGWNDQVFSIISELVLANANQRKSCIVVLGDKDKVEMEEAIRDNVGRTGRTRIVCRSGNPIDLADLDIASPHTAKSIIILAPPAASGDPDSNVIKTMLALTNNPRRRPEPYHIVAEIRDAKNMEVARLVGKDEVELVLVGDLISRIIAQTCRQSGLSVVYSELLDFGGDEIYFHEEPALRGQTFGEALLKFEDSTVIGVQPAGGVARLNPPMDTVINAGDRLIVISEDDDTIRLAGHAQAPIQPRQIVESRPAAPAPERSLILGWNWRAPSIINELDHYVAPGSVLTVVSTKAEAGALVARLCADARNQQITCVTGDTTDRRTLDGLDVTSYEHVIVLSYADDLDEQQADAHTLITLLHLRDLADRAGQPLSIVSEMLDLRNRTLAEVTKADDFIVSDRLVSLMLSQVSENKQLNAVFADIFDPEGSEIYVKPAGQYVCLDEPVNFYTVVEAARRRGEVAIGYRRRALAGDAAQSYGVVVNPDKSQMVTFGKADRVIVIAEE
jgi:voltage-gated potassium channel Kch